MLLQKNDFIEIEFTGRIKDTGEIFDSNIKSDLASVNLQKKEIKPFVFALGQGMFLHGIEDFLLGKPETSVDYKIELSPEKSFGPRIPQLIQLVPIKIFSQQKIYPVQGALFNFDGRIGKILSVSGGRVRVDFNNPIAGKTVVYDVKVLRKIIDLNEKIKSFVNFLFRKDIPFELGSGKITLKVEENLVQFVHLFEEKFKELFDMKIEIEKIPQNSNPENLLPKK